LFQGKCAKKDSERKIALFDSGSDDDAEEPNIEVRPQFHGKKGQKVYYNFHNFAWILLVTYQSHLLIDFTVLTH
jgi:hypothetical protein